MSNRTFCVLLASVLMLLGAAASLFKKGIDSAEISVQDASAQVEQEAKAEEILLPAFSWIAESFGAAYSEEYGQWFFREKMTIKTQAGGSLYAPVSGVVEKIEGIEAEGQLFSTGSRISLRCGQVTLILYPIYGIRVFEGSRVTQHSVLGSTDDTLMMYAEKDGVPINPMTVRAE